MRQIEKLTRKPGVPFTLERKLQYLDYFRNHPDLGGRKYLCAEAVGVATSTVDYHIKHDPEFAEAFEEMRQSWIEEQLFTKALERATNGTSRPIVGGKFRDQVVATEQVYSDSLMLAMLKAHKPEFKDKESVAAGGKGGVMIVPSGPRTVEDWEVQYGKLSRGDHEGAQPKK